MPTQFCTTHKNVETLRICGRCERPFCPDCLVVTPVGGRCRECARGPRIARLKIELWRWPLIALTAAIGGVAGGLVVGLGGFFILLILWFGGMWLAGVILAVSGRKPGWPLAAVAIAFIVLGVLGSGAVDGAMGSLRNPADYASLGAAVRDGLVDGVLTPLNWIAAGIMAVAAYNRLR